MSDIIDIVATLTYDVDDSDLKTNVDVIKNQIALIDQQKTKLAELQKQYKAATDPALQENLKRKIDNTTQSITKQTAAVTVQIANNKKLNEAISEELGLISKLEKTLANLQEGKRFATNTADIAAYTRDIKGVEKELANLKGLGGGEGGILATILGFNASGGSLGKQLLNGTLLGLGVGGGFGLITRAVSGLIDGLSELGDAYFNTDKNQEAFRQHSEQLSSALLKEVENLNKLDEQLRFIDTNETSDALKREIELIKAKGVVQGEVFKHQKEIFEAEQKDREEEKHQLNNNLENYKKVRDAVDDAARSVKKGVLNEGVTPGSGNFPRIRRAFNASGADSTTLNNIFLDIKKSGVSNAINPDLTNALFKVRQDLDLKILEEQNKTANKQTEIDARAKEFTSKLEEEQYELQRTLAIRLRELRSNLGQQYLKEQEANDRVTEQTIKKQNDLERNLAIARVDDEIELSRKKGVLTAEIEAQYGQVKANINTEFNDKIRQQTLEFHIKQIQQTKALQDSENKNQLDALNTQLKSLQENDEDTFGTRQAIAQKQAEIELSDVNKKYTALFEAARKNGDDTTELTKEYNQAIEDFQFEANRKSIKALEGYYNDRETAINRFEEREKSLIQSKTDDKLDILLGKYLEGSINATRLLYKERIIQLKNNLKLAEEEVVKADKQLNLALEKQKAVLDNPNANPEDVKNAGIGVNKAKNTRVNAVNNQARAEIELQNVRLQNLQIYLSSYQQVTEQIVASIDKVLEAQQRALDVEISIREKRVEQARLLAERGNAAVLDEEQKRLEETSRLREKAARKEATLNSGLALSNALVAMTGAIATATKGDPYTLAAREAAAVISVISALTAAYAFVSSFSQDTAPGFKDGVVDLQGPGTSKSDSINARLSKHESVMTAEATAANKEILTLMNQGHKFTIPQYNQPNVAHHFASKTELQSLERKLDRVADNIENLSFRAENRLDRNGVHQIIEAQATKERNRRS